MFFYTVWICGTALTLVAHVTFFYLACTRHGRAVTDTLLHNHPKTFCSRMLIVLLGLLVLVVVITARYALVVLFALLLPAALIAWIIEGGAWLVARIRRTTTVAA